MAEAQKNHPQAQSRRAGIVAVATDLFLENGFAATSMAMVARAAGLTKATLYHHYPGKADLFAACVTDGYADELARLADIAADPALSHSGKLRAAITALYASMTDTAVGRMSPLIAEVSRAFPTVARSFHDDYVAPQHALFTCLIDEGVAKGDFADQDRDLILHMVFGPIVTLSLSREMFATFDDLDCQFPVKPLRDGHIDAVLRLLARPA